MSTSNRFDQVPDVNYGVCQDCGKSLTTQAAAQAHMDATFEQSTAGATPGSHSVLVTNPERPKRVQREIDIIIDRRIEQAIEDVSELIDKGDVTQEEVTSALRRYPDFDDAWADYCHER